MDGQVDIGVNRGRWDGWGKAQGGQAWTQRLMRWISSHWGSIVWSVPNSACTSLALTQGP